MKKQTAVEWYRNTFFKALQEGLTISEGEIIFEQAIAMEKEQIMEAYMKAKLEHIDTLGLNAVKNKIIKDTEQYFQETYGGDK